MHAGGEQTLVDAFPTHAAFFNMTFGGIVARCLEWTVAEAVAASDAGILIVDYDAVLALGVRAHGAAIETGWLVTMVAGQRVKRAVAMGINIFAQWVQLAPDHAGLEVVLIFASHSTGGTANA